MRNSTLDQYAEVLPPPNFVPEEQSDGFAYLNAETFYAGFAGDTNQADAAFLRDSQGPISMTALAAPVTSPHGKPNQVGTSLPPETAPSRPHFCAAPPVGSARKQRMCLAVMWCS